MPGIEGQATELQENSTICRADIVILFNKMTSTVNLCHCVPARPFLGWKSHESLMWVSWYMMLVVNNGTKNVDERGQRSTTQC